MLACNGKIYFKGNKGQVDIIKKGIVIYGLGKKVPERIVAQGN